jgi:hypothetical protein
VFGQLTRQGNGVVRKSSAVHLDPAHSARKKNRTPLITAVLKPSRKPEIATIVARKTM